MFDAIGFGYVRHTGASRASRRSCFLLVSQTKQQQEQKQITSETDQQFKNLTFVNVDPSNFRDVVQRLTRANTASTVQKLPIIISPHPVNGKHNYVDVGPIRPSFNLQEQRQSKRNVEQQLNQHGLTHGNQTTFAPRKIVMNTSPLSTLDTFST
ncbi:hypothetical protein POM88_043612 [Heracleum sosnowskyi]|uniref:VQ domain-containing protein n=1 Tax=Heracleum sosnowskyi TaxID=360622 RepID=A0AAD8H2R1_9APIA|nr:hypothetical protein POM88_043612 [Heracleum sosnowskyi]